MDLNLSGLNKEQREAVTTLNGALLLLAGAGTGKTRVVTHRIAYLISSGIGPESILAVTFTNKAAREMKERVAGLLDRSRAEAVSVCTFHSFCARLLRQNIHHLGYDRNFTIAGSAYQTGLIRALMSELHLHGEGRDPAAWLAAISRAKCALIGPPELRESAVPYAGEIARVYETYQKRMKQMSQVDFDDLLVLVLRLWETKPDILAHDRERFRYLLIDEYQDTSPIQFRLMAELAGEPASSNICAVGDDDQSIYGWRGADIANILEFERHFPGAKVIRLECNYRSTNVILEAANSVIAHNRNRHAKKLWSHHAEGEKVLAVRAKDEAEEAAFVVDLLREKRSDRPRYSDFAVLLRSNHQTRLLENAMRKAGIPYSLVGGKSFFKRKEILDAISLLDVVNNPMDDLSLLRILNVPPRGLGDKAIDRLKHWQHITAKPLQQLLGTDAFLTDLAPSARTSAGALHQAIISSRDSFAKPGGLKQKATSYFEAVGYLSGFGKMYKPKKDALARLENVHELLEEMDEFESRKTHSVLLRDFLETFALLDANDSEQEDYAHSMTGAVSVMTVHAAKRLEFPVVIVPGMERGLFPHLRALEGNTEEEERRLFYVALTRAQKEAILIYAEKRKYRGRSVRRRPSSFLDEIPENVIHFATTETAFKPVSHDTASEYLAQMRDMFK